MGRVLGALDIGTQTTTLLAGEYEDGRLNIIARVTAQTDGVKKGIIRNIDAVVGVIQRVREEMSKLHGVDIYDVMIAFSAHAILATPRSGRKSLVRGHEITQEDVDAAEDNAYTEEVPGAQEVLLQRFRQRYEVNGQLVAVPLGMTGTELVANVLEVSAPRSAVDSLRTAVARAGLRVVDVVFAGIAAAEAVLDAKARDDGAIVIDIGGGTTDYVAFCNGVVAAAGTLGVGGNHITNDLAQAFQIQQLQAEEMKLARGAAMIQPSLSGDRYPLRMTQFSTADRTVSVHAIQTVTNERVDETLRLVRALLGEQVLQQIHGHVYLTGGSAALPQIAEKATAIFGRPCSLGAPKVGIRISKDMMDEPFRHATVLGLLYWRGRYLSAEEGKPSLFSRFYSFLRG